MEPQDAQGVTAKVEIREAAPADAPAITRLLDELGYPDSEPAVRERVAWFARRRVPFTGVTNCRDLGGYPTPSGGSTRWGQVFRSDSLHALTADDLELFHRMGLRRTYDLRRDEERAASPAKVAGWRVPVISQRLEDAEQGALRSREDGERWLFEDYCGMLDRSGTVFGRLFSHLAEPDGAPAVFYCMGGKDRTGVAAALLLTWLGVDRDTVLDDYELTAKLRGPALVPDVVDPFVGWGIARPAAAAVLDAPRWAMAAALERLDQDHGGIEAYLQGPCGMDPAVLQALRDRLVIPGDGEAP